MTVTVTKPQFNLRDELNSVRKKTGIKGEELMRANTMADAYNALNPTMFRNKIINGDFRIWQRGTTTTNTGGTYTADMLVVEPRSSTSTTIVRSTDVPAGEGFAYSARAYATNSTDDGFHLRIPIELPATGVYGEFQPNTTWTLSMWAKSAYEGRPLLPAIFLSSGAISVTNSSVGVSGLDRRYLTTYWKKYTWTVTLPTWVVDSGSLSSVTCLLIRLLMGADNTPTDYYLTGIQFERGGQATPFEHRPLQLERELCYRYYRRYAPGDDISISLGSWRAVDVVYAPVWFDTEMRTAPSLSYSSVGGWGGSIAGWHGGSIAAFSVITLSQSTPNHAFLSCTCASNPGASVYTTTSISSIGSSSWMAFSAEL